MTRHSRCWVVLIAAFTLFQADRPAFSQETSIKIKGSTAPAASVPNELVLEDITAADEPKVKEVKLWDDTAKDYVAAPVALFQIVPPNKLRVNVLTNSRYKVTITFKDGEKTGEVALPFIVKNKTLALEDPEATPPAPTLSIGAVGDSLDALYTAVPQHPQKQFENLVVDLAKGWGATATGRKNYVFDFDYTPEDTCAKISAILRETVAGLGTPDAATLAAIDKVMKGRFEQFYVEGDSRFRTKNPRKEDWQPFLQHLSAEVHKIVSASGLDTNPAYLKIVLLELANGFDRLAKEITALEDSVRGGGNGTATGGSTTGTSATGYGTGGSISRYRKLRRRICHLKALAP